MPSNPIRIKFRPHIHEPRVYKFEQLVPSAAIGAELLLQLKQFRQYQWAWTSTAELLRAITSIRRLQNPDYIDAAIMHAEPIEKFHLLMTHANGGEAPSGTINYIVDSSDSEEAKARKEPAVDLYFDEPYDRTNVLNLMRIGPEELFVPFGWAQSVLNFIRLGFQYADRIDPRDNQVSRDMLFLHGNYRNTLHHAIVTRSGSGATWRHEPIRLS